MSDPNLTDFYARIDRIAQMRARGYGFEAAGTLGRPGMAKPRGRGLALLRSLAFVLICAFGVKAMMQYRVGPDLYDSRVARLQDGDAIDRLGAALMRADPVTLYLADQLRLRMPAG